jgi:uncharacterized protein YutE (UPF0331/DUF86 family)
VNASIDIAKILLASNKQAVPKTYREALRNMSLIRGFLVEDCEALASFSKLRNLLALEYLEYRYPSGEEFITKGPEVYKRLVKAARLASND